MTAIEGMYVNLIDKIDVLADAVCGMDTGEVWSKFTCEEIEALAEVLIAGFQDYAAVFIISEHAYGDVDEEDQHHDIYLEHEAKGLTDKQGGTA